MQKRSLIGLLAADGISATGNLVTLIAVPWFVLQTTGSPTRTGVAAAFATVPVILAGPLGGVVIDRLGARRVSVIGDVLSGSSVAAIAMLDHLDVLEYWHVLALVFLAGLLDVPAETGRSSVLPDVAQASGTPLERAASARSGVLQAAGLIGGPIAGGLIAVVGPTQALYIDASTFALSAFLGFVSIPPRRPGKDSRPPFLAELTEGWRFVRNDPLLRAGIGLVMFMNFIDQGFFAVLLPLVAKGDLNGAGDLGLLIGAFGFGALTGTLVYGAAGKHFSRRRTLIVSLIAIGVPRFVVFASGAPLEILVIVVALTGLAAGPVNPILSAVFYERLPPEMRGRVLGLMRASLYGAIPLGSLAAGFAAGTFGLTSVLLGSGVLYLLANIALLHPVWLGVERRPELLPPDRSGPAPTTPTP